MPAPTFAELLRHYRMTRGFSLEALARRARIPVDALKLLEQENRLPPHKETVEDLADFLDLEGRQRREFLAAASPEAFAAAQPPAPAPETGPCVLIFLIADVRGYTRFTLEHGDAAAAQLTSKFAALARAAVEARTGRLLEVRGDEILACFRSVRQALYAAMEMQARFIQETQADPALPLPVGIGLDAGEVASVEGGDRGAALNLAARLCSQAGPGEVLASEGLYHLARKVDGLRYLPHSTAQLKGFDEPVRILHVQPHLLLEQPGDDS